MTFYDRTEIGRRLKDLRSATKGLTQTEVGRDCGLKKQQISAAEKGHKLPPLQLLNYWVNRGIALDWLLNGREPKYWGERLEAEAAVRIVSAKEMERLERVGLAQEDRAVPLVADRAAAGDPLEINDADIEGYMLIPKEWLRPEGRYSCVRIRGTSMLPLLGPGDIVAINHSRRVPHELRRKIIALSLPEEGVTIKHLDVQKDHLYIWAENRAEWEPRFLDPREVRIVGVVEWAWRRFE